MKNFIKGILFLLLFINYSCKPNMSDLESELLQTDREFSAYSVEHGMIAAFLSYYDTSGTMLRPFTPPLEGIDAIREHLTRFPDTSYVISWEPVKAVVSSSGDLGYTYGIFTFSPKSNPEIEKGTYVTIWKKNKNNEWKVMLDTGNDGID